MCNGNHGTDVAEGPNLPPYTQLFCLRQCLVWCHNSPTKPLGSERGRHKRLCADFDAGEGPAAAAEAGRLAALAAVIALSRSLLMMTVPCSKSIKLPQDGRHVLHYSQRDLSPALHIVSSSYITPALQCRHLPSNGYIAKRLTSLHARRGGDPTRVQLPPLPPPRSLHLLCAIRDSRCYAAADALHTLHMGGTSGGEDTVLGAAPRTVSVQSTQSYTIANWYHTPCPFRDHHKSGWRPSATRASISKAVD